MKINADLDQTAHLSSDRFEWTPSPLAGVERVMLDRVGGEVAVATSIVRYEAGARFDAHDHELGEEFVVLSGVFSDEHGDFPAGSYVRNPPGTRHTPHSDPGCVIWVKLRQFSEADITPLVSYIDPITEPMGEPTVQELYRFREEVVTVVRIPRGERFAFDANPHVREALVLEGEVAWQQDSTHRLAPWSWLRMRPGEPLRLVAQQDSLVLSKTRPIYRPID